MVDTSGTYQRVSVLEAARILGVSPTTVRRMVKAGTLEVERVLRPQGHTFRVLVPADIHAGATTHHQVSAEARTEVPPSEQMATWAASLLVPIAAELGEARQAMERQSETIRDQAETIGRQGAELERATSTVVALGDDHARVGRRATMLAIVLAVLIAITLVAGTLAVVGWRLQ